MYDLKETKIKFVNNFVFISFKIQQVNILSQLVYNLILSLQSQFLNFTLDYIKQQNKQNKTKILNNKNFNQKQQQQMRRQQQALIAEDQLKQTKKKTFKCLKCKKYSRSPVLTRCGHLFCWQCLYTATSITPSCPQCMELWNIDECYPVYTDYQEQQSINQLNQQNPNSSNQLSTQNPIIDSQKPIIEVPSRPPAKHMQKILNPNMIGAGAPLSFNSLPSNLPMKRMLAGHVFLSPLGVNSFSVIEEGNQNDEDFKLSQKYKIRMHLAIICTILMIVYFLF